MAQFHVVRLFLFPFAALALTGCATIVASGPDLVPVDSNPSGARVLLDTVPIGRTPMTAAMQREGEGLFTFELEGYETVTLDRNKVLNGWFLGNIIFGGLIGITVDLITHNQGKYSTTPVHVELVRRGQPSTGPLNTPPSD